MLRVVLALAGVVWTVAVVWMGAWWEGAVLTGREAAVGLAAV